MKALRITLVSLLILISSFLFFACGENVPIEGINFTVSQVELFKGNTTHLYLEFSPKGANNFKLEWSTSDKEIVEVNDEGKITAKDYGDATITASVKNSELKAECHVKVTDGNVFKIELDDTYVKKDYYEGQSFNPNGLKVFAYYQSGETKEIPSNKYQLAYPQTLTESTSVIVTYLDFTKTFDIVVQPDNVLSLSVKTAPTKTTYYIGETFDPSGMEVVENYASGKIQTVTDFTFDKNPISYDTTRIKIAFDNYSTYQYIEAKAKIVVNDIAELQEIIDNSSDGDSIMIKEGSFNTGTTITIPSSKKIIIYGENTNVYLYAHNTPFFTIIDDGIEGDITFARLNMVLAQGENINLISNPNNVKVNLIDIIFQN